MEENTNKRGISVGMTVGVAILAAIVFGVGAYLYANNQATQEKEALNTQIVTLQNEVSSAKKVAEATPNSSAGATATTDATATWATYTDTTYNFRFKYPKGLVVQSASNNAVNYYTILINKSEDVGTDGGDFSHAYLQIGNSSSITGSQVTIKSPSGEIAATYSTKITAISDTPVAYIFYYYEFQKGGKYYLFGMNNWEDTPLMTPDQFKQLVDTITFN